MPGRRLGSPADVTGGRAVGNESFGETRVDEETEPSITRIGGDRRCPQCDVKLSQYNPGPNCWSHTIGWPWRGPSAKPRF